MREAIGPLDRQHAAMKFFQPQIVGRCPLQAIQIDVIQRQPSTSIFVHQRERRTAHLFGIDSESCSEPADERRLPRPKVSR